MIIYYTSIEQKVQRSQGPEVGYGYPMVSFEYVYVFDSKEGPSCSYVHE